MIERDDAAVEIGQKRVADILDGALKRGKLTEDARRDAQNRFAASTDYAVLSDVGLVVEAVFEDMGVKREVFAVLDNAVPQDAIIASNTSYLDVSALARLTKRPERVIGLHFFSPAHVMKLLEVIIPETASDIAVATGLAFGKRLGKISVPSGVCDGFIGNRIYVGLSSRS